MVILAGGKVDEAAVAPQTKPESKETFGRSRFAPGVYTLDLSAAEDMPVKANGQPSTFGAVYCDLRASKIQQMPEQFALEIDKYVTDNGDIQLECHWPLRSTMRTLVDLMRQGIEPYSVMWFYYDNDWSRDMDECHVFFAIHGGKVVLESCHFSSEEPLVLRRNQDDDPVWHSHPFFDEAVERYWYRKFYTETVKGQLMVLRTDEPTLYHYERPQSRDVVRDLQVVTLVKMYRLLWVTVPLLVAIAFPSIREYMGIVAIVLMIDVLWRCWATRKAGQDD